MPTPDWQAIDSARSELLAPRLRVNQQEADEVKYVSYDFNDSARFPQAPPRVELMMLTDLQVGHKGFRRDRFLEYRAWLLAEPFRFVFLGGDIIDAATVLSVQSPYENTDEPARQLDEAASLLEPLAGAGRLLGYVGGNHERRTIKTFGDAGRLLARELQVPYSRGVQLIDIDYGRNKPFKVSLWHGGGAARTAGAKMQMLHRFTQQADSHVYMVGHCHDFMLKFDWRQQRVGGKIKLQKIAGVMSSSFLGYWGSFAEVAGLSPSDVMMARVVLEPSGSWEITAK